MIIFYDKKTGEVFATIDGRVHDQKTMECTITDDSHDKKNTEKMVIGWEEKGKEKIEHNLDHFEILQDIEDDTTPTKIYDFKIDHKLKKLIRNKEQKDEQTICF